MARSSIHLDDVTFFYDTAWLPVLQGVSAEFPSGWTGVIGANGSGKTTLLRLAAGELDPTEGAVHGPRPVVYCAQRTDRPPEELPEFLLAGDRRAHELTGRLGIGDDWAERWPSLSHGERKRGQIAVALWREPGALALDEPTNHVDRDARRMLAGALRSFRGVGLLVSHDRELLDSLCGRCLFFEAGEAVMRPGGYTKAVALAEADRDAALRERKSAWRERKRIDREVARRAREAAEAQRKRSKRGIDEKDHDAKFRINQARYSGKDGKAGRQYRQLAGRQRQAEERVAGMRAEKRRRLGIELPGQRSRRDILFRIPAGHVGLGDDRRLEFPELAMAPGDRVALTGPNGAGKTTLVRHILGRLDLPEGRLAFMDQEIGAEEARDILADVHALPRRRRGEVMSVVSRLGSDPERVLETEEPSPGELRKILLALSMSRDPWLIVMDEPTNHLDLPSIECLEEALATSEAALLMVSHDERFLERLATIRWEATADGRLEI